MSILKQLEITGFKSFAKPVTIEFDAPITGVVGPNGSGKSNVSEAIKWVLGEQSMKSLRGKRGEDLIFNGSGSVSQLGKAKVSITFDNSSKVLPLDFDEVIVSREVYRDGANEYKLNGSSVRLKDVVELMSNVGVGGSGHHIISQGEADRILHASPKEKRAMLEDALGLKIYQIKKAETERKLEHTETNMVQVEALRREVAPHLTFLRTQAKKVEASSKLREELRQNVAEYIAREKHAIDKEYARVEAEEAPYKKAYEELEKDLHLIRSSFPKGDEKIDTAHQKKQETYRHEMNEIEEQYRGLEREFGRLEGQLAVLAKSSAPIVSSHDERHIAVGEVKDILEEMLSMLADMENSSSVRDVQEIITRIRTHAESFLERLSVKKPKEDIDSQPAEEIHTLTKEKEFMNDAMRKLAEKRDEMSLVMQKENEDFISSRRAHADAERRMHDREAELYTVKETLQKYAFMKERVRLREDEWTREHEEMKHIVEQADMGRYTEAFSREEREQLRRSIQRLKIKLEEVGGIDTAVLEEYNEVAERDQFLEKELSDLRESDESLRALMEELQTHLEHDFQKGITQINIEFAHLFQTMFGGGNASLITVKEKKRKQNREEEYEQEENGVEDDGEAGIEIAVDLPRKRIKNLDMLSGGERALTSIALLFAMSIVNPPPFLVLDETDAALDEANSQRYGAMLQQLSKETQLIVITHNRQTMKEAGILYGVTMGSDGISKILSVKFNEEKTP